jgi:hypothetical protein
MPQVAVVVQQDESLRRLEWPIAADFESNGQSSSASV